MPPSSGSPYYPCAACKLLRRKCMPDCIFAPYFPPENLTKFANVHKVFSASNISKILRDIPPIWRQEAADSLAFEAEARLLNPVYGCVGHVSILYQQLKYLQHNLHVARAELSHYMTLAGMSGELPLSFLGLAASVGTLHDQSAASLSGMGFESTASREQQFQHQHQSTASLSGMGFDTASREQLYQHQHQSMASLSGMGFESTASREQLYQHHHHQPTASSSVMGFESTASMEQQYQHHQQHHASAANAGSGITGAEVYMDQQQLALANLTVVKQEEELLALQQMAMLLNEPEMTQNYDNGLFEGFNGAPYEHGESSVSIPGSGGGGSGGQLMLNQLPLTTTSPGAALGILTPPEVHLHEEQQNRQQQKQQIVEPGD